MNGGPIGPKKPGLVNRQRIELTLEDSAALWKALAERTAQAGEGETIDLAALIREVAPTARTITYQVPAVEMHTSDDD